VVVTRGESYCPAELPGFVIIRDTDRVGLVTYHIEGQDCEIVTLNSMHPSMGIGSALISALVKVAKQEMCKRIWVITTNDNTGALRFYQKKGFVLVAVYRNAIKESRQIKPEIPLIGYDGIPIRDEIELEYVL
jgi:ribosomal protein S18 acetylase RimI-like enzyme